MFLKQNWSCNIGGRNLLNTGKAILKGEFRTIIPWVKIEWCQIKKNYPMPQGTNKTQRNQTQNFKLVEIWIKLRVEVNETESLSLKI